MTTIKARHERLTNILRSGIIMENDKIFIIDCFNKYYITDGEKKLNNINDVKIDDSAYGTQCFYIKFDDWFTISIKRLAGSKPSNNGHVLKALRNAIQSQIFLFTMQAKKPKICPLLNIPIGDDAEVDHIVLFADLVKQWGINATAHYDTKTNKYVLNEPFLKSWCDFHKNNAQLRWVSKQGNRTRSQILPANPPGIP